jgi:UvrD-like helicase C-terminal domain/Nuclease-related domain/AAA domain
MARMYPENLEGFEEATEGERKVFAFIREAARPHKDFTCWYQPSIGSQGKVPDFLLYGKKLGLLVLEVKDWASHQILSYTPHLFTVQVSAKTEQKTNPLRQAKGYANALMEGLREIPDFVSREPAHEGGLKIPVGRTVVFPNISRDEYEDRGIRWLIPMEMTLLRDDLDPDGEILCDLSGRKFQQRIAGAFLFPFKGLTGKQEAKLHFALWPEGKIRLPARQGAAKEHFQRDLEALDDAQAKMALRLGPGHQVVKGPPGSGKTLVLVHRCCQLRRYQPKIKRVLLVCFNIALVSYLKRLVQERAIGTGDGGVHVSHFFELCSKVLGENVRFENESSDYYDLVAQETLDRVKAGKSRVEPFDAVLVDEGQDFDDLMLKVVLALLKPGGDFVLSLDSYQDLYMRRPSWKSVGIKAGGRTHHLKRVYRNTKSIFDFTQRFIGQEPRAGTQLALLTEAGTFQGAAPEILKFRDSGELEAFLLKDLMECLRRGEYKRSETGIIYDDKVYGPDRFSYDNRALPMRLLRSLEGSGVPSTWVSQDVRSKEMYDITTDRVSLISIHSSKGLDFDLVYLVGLDHIHPAEEMRQSLVSLVYVAMTRAKVRLVIPYVEETDLIKRILDCRPS